MWLTQQEWNDIKGWNMKSDPTVEAREAERSLLEQLAGFAQKVELAPAPHLILPETVLVELPGITIPAVLIPIVDWQGTPAVVHIEAVEWRVWEDMQIAREMERQILEDSAYGVDDWGRQYKTVRINNLITESFKADLAYMEKIVAESLCIAISKISAPSRLLTQHFSIKDLT